MPFFVRRAEPADAAAIAKVQVQTWRDGYRGVVAEAALQALDVDDRTAYWRDVFAAGRVHVLVAVAPSERADASDARDGEVFAFAAFGPTRDDDMPGAAELYQIYVSSSRWRSGAGAALLAAAVDALRALGFAEVALWVLVDNTRARTFYEAHGWHVDEGDRGRRVVTAGAATGLVEMRYRRALANSKRDEIT